MRIYKVHIISQENRTDGSFAEKINGFLIELMTKYGPDYEIISITNSSDMSKVMIAYAIIE